MYIYVWLKALLLWLSDDVPLPPPPTDADLIDQPWYRPELIRNLATDAVRRTNRVRACRHVDMHMYRSMYMYM